MATVKAQLEELSGVREDALKEARLIVDAAQETSEGLTDELQAKVKELTEAADEADEAIKELLARDEASSALIAKIDSFVDHKPAIANARGVHLHNPVAEDTQAKWKIPATVRRFGTLRNFTGDVDGTTPEERAYRFGQYAMAKLSCDLPGRYQFRQALNFARDHFGFQPTAIHGEGASDTSGAHVFVPDEFGMDLIRLREQYGIARQVFMTRSMSSDTRTDPRRTGGLTAYFVGENAQITESTAAYDSVTLTAKKLAAITRMSNELDEDSVINFGDELAGEISYAFANKEDECAFNGDGTSTYGGMYGIRPRLATLTAGTAPGFGVGTGNAYSELVLTDFEYVVGGLPVYADVPGQVSWICHKTFFHTVMVKLALAAGGVNSTEIVGGVPRQMFLGYPVRFSQVFPSTTANDQVAVIFGNFSMGASFGDRRNESISFSDQAYVNGQSLWERDQLAVRGTERFDINVHDFGTDTAAGPIGGLAMAGS